jgi:SPP1 family predicted phage head-tail adaptor
MIVGNIDRMLDRLGKTLEVQIKITTDYDPVAGNISVWVKDYDVLGAIENLSGNEMLKANKLGVEATHRLYISSTVSINENKRIYDSVTNKYYRITYVDDPMHLGDFLEIYLFYTTDYESDGGE